MPEQTDQKNPVDEFNKLWEELNKFDQGNKVFESNLNYFPHYWKYCPCCGRPVSPGPHTQPWIVWCEGYGS